MFIRFCRGVCLFLLLASGFGFATQNETADSAVKLQVLGAVHSPGPIVLTPAMATLSQALASAGGLMNDAYPFGAILWRMAPPLAEKKINGLHCAPRPEMAALLAMKLYVDLAEVEGVTQALIAGSLVRMPVSIDEPAGRSIFNQNPPLKDGDILVIPPRQVSVIVAGEVRDAGARRFISALHAEDYIRLSGGLTATAGKPALIYPDGRVIALKLDAWNYEPVAVPPGSVIYAAPADQLRRCSAAS